MIQVVIGVLSGTAVLVFVVIFILCRSRSRSLQQQQPASQPATRSLETVVRPRNQSVHEGSTARLRPSGSMKADRNRNQHRHLITHHAAPFRWGENPLLVEEAVESGWPKFKFATLGSASTATHRSAPLWGLCADCDVGGRMEREAQSDWELAMTSSEFMQTIRLNPGGGGGAKMRTGSSSLCGVGVGGAVHDDSNSNAFSSVRMSLPLPGPPLGRSSFPQEAYFEITILYFNPQHRNSRARASKRAKAERDAAGDHAKLIQASSVDGKADALIQYIHDDGRGHLSLKNLLEKQMSSGKEVFDGKHNHLVISVGLTKGGSPPFQSTPGTYLGSIGFNSNGSVFLDGTKLVFESEKAQWLGVNRVIGCGFDPSKKKVFLTVDSELVQVIQCSSDIYKSPLYPVIATNADAMLLVNMGQTEFKYSPANAQRTPDPCFFQPDPGNVPDAAFGYESSQELFSMHNIGPEWCQTKSKSNNSSKTDIEPEWLQTKKKSESNGSSKTDMEPEWCQRKNNSRGSSKRNTPKHGNTSVATDYEEELELFEISLQN